LSRNVAKRLGREWILSYDLRELRNEHKILVGSVRGRDKLRGLLRM
jgi:hypothetical protein